MRNFDFIRGTCGKFDFDHWGLKNPQTSKFVPKNGFQLRTKGRRSWGQEGTAKGQEGCTLGGKKAPHLNFLGQI